jgi:long-chain fatty acid transport protein
VYGTLEYPETVSTRNGFGADVQLPAAQRYILLEQGGIALNTTLGAGYEVMDNLRIGAGFVWGFASYKVANANMSVSPTRRADGSYRDPVTADVRADLDVADWFMPGLTFGVLYSPIDRIDVGANVVAQEAFDAHGDLSLKANYWTTNGVSGNTTVTKSADVQKGLAHFRIANPLDARLGARYHHPRSELKKRVRDPLADDVFDVELDVSYTRNSAYQRAELRFPNRPIVPVLGTPGNVPENNDFEFRVKGDTIGLRVGGDYVVLPAQLAVRAGGWYEPNVSNDAYANVAFLASQRFGLALGGVYRVGPVDVEAGYMHVFVTPVDNGGNGKLLVVSGDASAGYRSPYPINGGRFTQSANIFSLGATARF